MTKKTRYLGWESGKSSGKSGWFSSSSQPSDLHPKGNGASTGNGRTSDKSILGKIAVVFKGGKK